MTDVGVLRVVRPTRGSRDLARSYEIKVDGTSRGSVKRGRDFTVELPAGTHSIRASIDWAGSPTLEVDIRAGQVVELVVEPSGSAFRMWQIFSRSGYLKLSR
jgi:hypothetical protein